MGELGEEVNRMKAFISKSGLLAFLIILFPIICLANDTITGRYCYTYGDKESLMEAKELTHTLAIRNAIESYRVYIESTGTVKNFILTNDIIQIISSGYLKDIKVIDYKEQGRTICETIQANVSSQEIEKIIRQRIQNTIERIEETGIDNNGYLKIIGIEEFKKEYELSGKKYVPEKIEVKVKVLKKISSNDEKCIVFVAFYDSAGKELHTWKRDYHDGVQSIWTSKIEHGTLYPGEIIWYSFARGDRNRAVSYKVWLYKEK